MDQFVSWLMEGDPAIRWQTMRDLLDSPPRAWKAERQRTLEVAGGHNFWPGRRLTAAGEAVR